MAGPRPAREGGVPLLIGGGGERRTLGLAAREADEWNFVGLDLEAYRAKTRVLAEHCQAVGRDPAQIRRSIMAGYLVGRNQDELHQRVRALAEVVPRLAGMDPGEALDSLRERWLVGTPAEVAERMRRHMEAGVDLFMLQHFLMDDSDALELLAGEVAPAIA